MNSMHETDGNARSTLFLHLYQSTFPSVASFVAKRGGSFEQAKDVFQDALVIYYEKITCHSLVIEQDHKSYIFGICKHLWFKSYQKSSLLQDIGEHTLVPEEEVTSYSEKKLLQLLSATGKKCMALLKSFYYDKLPMVEIAETFGFSGTRSATVQKFKCLEKVRNTVKEKALNYESFLE